MIGPQDHVGPHRLDPRDIDAAVFDVGGVFLYPDHAALQAQARERGLDLELADEVFRRAHHAACRALTDHGSVDERSAGFWAVYDRRYLDELGIPPDRAAELAVALRVSWGRPHAANIAALHRLAATGMPLAIVSNNDGSAAEQLARAGVCQVGAGPLPPVAAVIDSGAVGVAKPDPAIFRLAIDVLGTEAARTLYVGDTVHADVVGARAAGLAVVQVDPYHHHADFDHHRVGDLDELLDWLGVPPAR
jgi:putative hydrolase of the HAD superfamily